MAKEKNYINLSINELEKYIEKKYADVLASYPLGVMEIRKGIKLTTLEDGSLYLDTLNIRTAAQGQGKGKEVLNILKNWADANKVAIYIKPAYLPDNPTFKGIETTPEKQVENLFNFYKNNGWEDNPNFTSLSPNEQSAQLSLSANAEWGASTDDLYSPLVYTPEGVDIPELPKNPYINDIISTAEKFNIDGKAFVDGYNQPILDETIQGILKIEPIFGLSGYGLEVDEWKKSKFSEISDLLVEQGIDPSDIKDISKYIPRDKILTPAQIFQGNMRNEYFTDEIVEMLKEDVGGFFELDDAGDELFPQNRPKRNYRLYYIISQGDDVGGKLYQEYVQDISGPFNKTPEPTKWIDYLVKGKRTVEPDTPTNVVDDFGQKGIKWADARKALEDVNNWGDDIPLLLETFIPNPGNLPVDKIILEIIPPEGNIEGLIPSEDYRLQASILRENGDIEIIKTYDNPRQFGADGKNFFNDISFIDTPGGSLGAAKLNDPLVFDSWIDNYANTTTSFVDNLPLVKPVKDMFLNAADNRIKRLARQAATPGGILDAVDIWEIGVLALVAGAIAYNEIDEIPKIGYNAILRTYNLSQGRPIDAPLRIIGLPTLEISEYDIDFEYAMETLERGEKVMPTDIIIKELAESSLEKGEPAVLPGTGVTATTGIDEEFAPYKESIIKEREETARIKRDEVKQKILESKGVQEEKMFEQAKPKKSKATGGAGAKIL